MSIYSWGGTPIQLEMTNLNALAYNRVVNDYIQMSTTPIPLDQIKTSREDFAVWDKVIKIIGLLVELNGGSLPYLQEDMNVAYLLKV